MTLYTVNLHWPRSSKQAVYSEEIEADTQGEAKLIAAGRAKLEGWKGSPIRSEARITKAVQA